MICLAYIAVTYLVTDPTTSPGQRPPFLPSLGFVSAVANFKLGVRRRALRIALVLYDFRAGAAAARCSALHCATSTAWQEMFSRHRPAQQGPLSQTSVTRFVARGALQTLKKIIVIYIYIYLFIYLFIYYSFMYVYVYVIQSTYVYIHMVPKQAVSRSVNPSTFPEQLGQCGGNQARFAQAANCAFAGIRPKQVYRVPICKESSRFATYSSHEMQWQADKSRWQCRTCRQGGSRINIHLQGS